MLKGKESRYQKSASNDAETQHHQTKGKAQTKTTTLVVNDNNNCRAVTTTNTESGHQNEATQIKMQERTNH